MLEAFGVLDPEINGPSFGLRDHFPGRCLGRLVLHFRENCSLGVKAKDPISTLPEHLHSTLLSHAKTT